MRYALGRRTGGVQCCEGTVVARMLDSRLRGNDGVMCGNDDDRLGTTMMCGNDGGGGHDVDMCRDGDNGWG